jgi:HPt (histidine-containing phosphotransfer) domain-containing protein
MTRLSAGLQAIFDDHTEDFLRRVATLEQGVAAILAGSLDEELRAAAQRDAHALVGALGTFGLPRGSELARVLEQSFQPAHESVASDDARLADVLAALREELSRQLGGPHPANTLHPDPIRGSVVDVGAAALRVGEHQELRRPTLETGLAWTNAPAFDGRILVVDDDPAVRRALALILSEAGYDVQDVDSARKARHVLAHDTIDLLLSDVRMPGETGLDLIPSPCASIRRRRRC